MPPKNPLSDDSTWRSILDAGNPDEIEHLLVETQTIDDELARAVRDFVALLVTSDPVTAHRISSALLEAAARPSGLTPSGSNRNGILAVAWRSRAETSAYVGKLKDSKSAYATASRYAERHGDPALRGQILVGRIGMLASLGKSNEAQSLVPQATRLLFEAGDLAYLARLHMNLGNAACHREEFLVAREEFARAAEYFDRIDQPGPLRLGLEMNQGIVYTELSQVAEARQVFLDVERKSKELGLNHFVAQARFNRGFLEGYFGDYRSALRLLEQAEETFRSEGALELIAGTELARSEIYLELGMGQEACELARAAVSGYDREEMALDAALSRFAESRALALQRDYAGSESILIGLDAFYRDRKIRPRRALVQLQLARVLLSQKRLAEARTVAKRALATLDRLQIGIAIARARTLVAEIDLADGRAREAEALLEPVLEDVDRLPTGDRITVWHLSGLISETLGERNQAKRRLDRAVRAVEAQRQLIPGVELRARAFEGHVRVYRDRIIHALRSRQPDFESLFSLVEAARARAFRERTNARGELVKRSREQWEETESVRARLGSFVQRMEKLQYDPDHSSGQQIADLRRQIVTLERRLMSALRKQALRAEGDPSLVRGGTKIPGSSAVERMLSPNEILVEYFVLPDRILALVLGAGLRRVVVLQVPPESLRSTMQTFHAQLESLALTAGREPPNLPFLKRAADALLERMFDALLRPLEIEDAASLLIVPHRFLHQVPFECMRTKDGYLIDSRVVRRVPSADFLLRRPAGGSPDGSIVLSGMVEGGPAFVESELAAVRNALDSPRTRFMRDASASELLEAFVSARWIHISTHGVFRGDNPLFSRLSTRGGALFLIDLLERRIDAELVVLSACNSGQVFAGEGDDLSGVAHGFLAAGAERLVASIWRVHDQATRDWMATFYQEVTSARGPTQSTLPHPAFAGAIGNVGEALRRASMRTRGSWDHPFYWGGFCLYG